MHTPWEEGRKEWILGVLMSDDQQESTPWLIDSIVPASALVAISGPSGSGKSLVAMDMAASIASGAPWHGHDVLCDEGLCVYVAACQGESAALRLEAWGQERGASAQGLRILPARISIDETSDASSLVDALLSFSDRMGLPILAVVLDDIFSCCDNHDDYSSFASALLGITSQTGASVILVSDSVPRLLGMSTQVELVVSRTPAGSLVRQSLNRIGERAEDVSISVSPVEVISKNGARALVAHSEGFGDALQASASLTKGEERVLSMIRRESVGGVCSYKDVRKSFREEELKGGAKDDSIRKSLSRAMSALEGCGIISRDGDCIEVA